MKFFQGSRKDARPLIVRKGYRFPYCPKRVERLVTAVHLEPAMLCYEVIA